MAYEGLSLDPAIKKKLEKLKGKRSWNIFFTEEVLPKLNRYNT